MDRIPSQQRELLAGLVGSTLTRVARVLFDDVSEILENEAYVDRKLGPRDLFAMSWGPVLLEAGDTQLFLDGTTDSYSIELEPWQEAFGDGATLVDASDAAHAQPRFGAVIGKRITGIRVLQLAAKPDTKLGDRPREAGLCFALEGGAALVVSFGLIPAPDNLAVGLAEDLPASGWTELFRLPA
ncbi:MAG TPA: hypothetical protein VGM88_03695 [Kofleriaceae bacterium]|jgi:hypothetical protein